MAAPNASFSGVLLRDAPSAQNVADVARHVDCEMMRRFNVLLIALLRTPHLNPTRSTDFAPDFKLQASSVGIIQGVRSTAHFIGFFSAGDTVRDTFAVQNLPPLSDPYSILQGNCSRFASCNVGVTSEQARLCLARSAPAVPPLLHACYFHPADREQCSR